jgi:chromosome segregation ATPase
MKDKDKNNSGALGDALARLGAVVQEGNNAGDILIKMLRRNADLITKQGETIDRLGSKVNEALSDASYQRKEVAARDEALQEARDRWSKAQQEAAAYAEAYGSLLKEHEGDEAQIAAAERALADARSSIAELGRMVEKEAAALVIARKAAADAEAQAKSTAEEFAQYQEEANKEREDILARIEQMIKHQQGEQADVIEASQER